MAKKVTTTQDLEAMGLVKQPDGTYRNMRNVNIKFQSKGEVVLNHSLSSGQKITLRVNVKPMSVNRAWAGRRFKTPEYKAYEQSTLSILPKMSIPLPPYKLSLSFGVSNKRSDIDNLCKQFIDILQKKYLFDDKNIYELLVKKVIVDKRKEYCEFNLEHLDGI